MRKSLAAVVACFLLSACGGNAAAPASGPASQGPASLGVVKFAITIPNQSASSSGKLTRDYVSSNTHSMTLVVNGGAPQAFALTPASNPNCSIGSGGVTICNGLSASAPFGTDAFTFNLYKESIPLPATPTLLSTITIPNEVVVQGVANQLGTFTLNPVVGSLGIGIAAASFAPGTAANVALNVTAKDPSGATIIAPGLFVNASGALNPVLLSSNQSVAPYAGVWQFSVDGGAAANANALNGPSDTANLLYSGSAVGATTITAAAGALSATQSISSLHNPIVASLSSTAPNGAYHIVSGPAELDFYTTGVSGTIALTEASYPGVFTLTGDTCNSTDNASATGNYATFSPGIGGTGNSFTVNSLAAGTSANPAICSATFSDSLGGSVSVTFSVTTIGFALQ